ncbi:peroxiredoxin (alkyl hydroperoxide reductase subunit C) [Altererythrobacter atlanticus]|uniref:Alkyl hydroperoxide reductase C n=1 Tax=Croceibacterium atlanticum TaxID=1267766 RepID=A0A0F7KUF0_9SPHN|nr:peroxiredoxin [Croceibacterium atlanticum]AKH42816.1 Alkyl hydroperoxide reductase subunit C [Croceibacterium atlanticum]MBB5731596.1 peroxiredoxin (alkyl hydroperoxide reductase subunit C) [Croceibacterium atlanticum]
MERHVEDNSLRIGDQVPHFTARSTQGPLDLGDYAGKWVILFSHPADFTPVCTSEFVALARAADKFAERDCTLIGVSIDSLYSHLAWIRMIYDMTGIEVGFPIVEDPTMEIARAFGMIGPEAHDASSIRATCFIDPDGKLQATTCYPANVGRSIPEMIRLLKALQRVSDGDVLAPADWQPGSDLLRAPRETVADVLRPEGASDWFFKTVKDEGGE